MIPINTTTIRVLRRHEDDEPFEAEGEPSVVASGVRAHISTSVGREETGGGEQEVMTFRMSCDPTEIHHLDRVEDEVTGEVYEVQWAVFRPGFGLDHTQAGLKQVSGAVSRP